MVPVSDVDRAIAFYRDQLGFNLDHDTRAGDQRFAQLTPPGSGCSIVLSEPSADAAGLARGRCNSSSPMHIAPVSSYVDRGVAAEEIDVIDERDGGTLFGFTDPDGNAASSSRSRRAQGRTTDQGAGELSSTNRRSRPVGGPAGIAEGMAASGTGRNACRPSGRCACDPSMPTPGRRRAPRRSPGPAVPASRCRW